MLYLSERSHSSSRGRFSSRSPFRRRCRGWWSSSASSSAFSERGRSSWCPLSPYKLWSRAESEFLYRVRKDNVVLSDEVCRFFFMDSSLSLFVLGFAKYRMKKDRFVLVDLLNVFIYCVKLYRIYLQR